MPKPNLKKARKLVAAVRGEARSEAELQYITVNTPDNIAIAELVKEQAAKVGITVTIRTVDQATLINDALAGNFQAMGFRNHSGAGDPDAQSVWWRSDSPINFGRIKDPEIDRLLDAGRVELDPEKRTQIYEDLNRRFADQAWNLWSWYTLWAIAAKPDVKGLLGPPLPDGRGKPYPLLGGTVPVLGEWRRADKVETVRSVRDALRRHLADAWAEFWSTRDAGALGRIYARDVVWWDVALGRGTEARGHDGLTAARAHSTTTSLRDARSSWCASSPATCGSRWSSWPSRTRHGSRVGVPGCAWLRLDDDGRIMREHWYWEWARRRARRRTIAGRHGDRRRRRPRPTVVPRLRGALDGDVGRRPRSDGRDVLRAGRAVRHDGCRSGAW